MQFNSGWYEDSACQEFVEATNAEDCTPMLGPTSSNHWQVGVRYRWLQGCHLFSLLVRSLQLECAPCTALVVGAAVASANHFSCFSSMNMNVPFDIGWQIPRRRWSRAPCVRLLRLHSSHMATCHNAEDLGWRYFYSSHAVRLAARWQVSKELETVMKSFPHCAQSASGTVAVTVTTSGWSWHHVDLRRASTATPSTLGLRKS